jgi:hypothetical protein
MRQVRPLDIGDAPFNLNSILNGTLRHQQKNICVSSGPGNWPGPEVFDQPRIQADSSIPFVQTGNKSFTDLDVNAGCDFQGYDVFFNRGNLAMNPRSSNYLIPLFQ